MKIKNLRKAFTSFLLSASLIIGNVSIAAPITSHAASQSNVYSQLANNIQDGTILHCFDWTYQQIIDELPNIAAAGFTSVQTSPAQQGVVGNSIWYYLYQPNGFYISDSGLGSENDLKRLCSEADKYGIKVIVDVVANHLAGDHSNIDSSLKGSEYWHQGGDKINYSNRYEITHYNIGMPDLNSEHSTVQNKVRNYIQQLKNDGVDGIRWDAAKHISLPSENCNFWSSVIDKSMFNYGEILDNPVENNQGFANSLIKEYTNYMSVTDSKYSSTILGAINGGSVSSSIGYWTQTAGVSDNKLVYWAESHDTYSNHTSEGGWTKYIDQNKIDRAYAIVASRNGATSLYFSRPSQTEKTAIKVGQKGSTHFKSVEVAAVNQFHNLCIGEPDYYTVSGNVAVTTRKSGAVLVLGSGSNQYVSVPNGGSYTTPGEYTDKVSGNKFIVTKDTISGTIGSTGIAVLYNTAPIPVNPTISADKESQTFVDSISVNYNIENADSYKIIVNGNENNATSQTYTETTTVVIEAYNSSGSDKKTYIYTKDSSEKRTIYLDTTNCSWFTNDSAVAAIKTDKDSNYTKMTTTTIAGKEVYTISVPSSASSAKIVRMLPSGKCYNEKEISLNASYNYYTSDSNWSTLTTSNYQTGDIKPTISFSVDSGTYNKPFTVTITVKDAKSASYTVNGTTNSFTDTATVTISETATLTVDAQNGTESAKESRTYTIEIPVDSISVYFTDNNNWGKVYAYTWGGSENTASWPGNEMSYVSTNKYNEKVYKIDIAPDVKGLIFNNGNGAQTIDITSGIVNGQGYYLTSTNGKCTVGTYTYGD